MIDLIDLVEELIQKMIDSYRCSYKEAIEELHDIIFNKYYKEL